MAEDEGGQWVLRPLALADLPSAIAIPDLGLTIGRAPENRIVLDKQQFPTVSGTHARVSVEDGVPVIEDLGSKNGTLVNGEHIRRESLVSGDIVEIGEHGPRFVVVRDTGLDDTLDVNIASPRRGGRFGNETISDLRKLIGAAQPADVQAAVRAGARRTRWTAIAVGVVVLVLAGWGVQYGIESGHRETEALRRANEDLQLRVDQARRAVDEQTRSFESERASLQSEKDQLVARIAGLETAGRSGLEEIDALRTQLGSTNERLEMFDPVSLEKDRLAGVANVQRAVVLIEATTYFREADSRRRLHVKIDSTGREIPNLEFVGELYKRESTGSGFCVSTDGHILTNAHVARPMGDEKIIEGPGGLRFVVETELRIVFTGESSRHAAEVLTVTRADEEDLALLRIEPFEEMPVLADFGLERPATPAGTDVYLHGFPLGKLVLQDGDTMVASTFRGVLSREIVRKRTVVEAGGERSESQEVQFLQIDAAVHPGNSGGPVTDSAGRVLGIVSRVQIGSQGQIAESIGYVIPIERARAVWPPPKE